MKNLLYIFIVLVFTSCNNKLFISYKKNGEKLEKIDLKKLNQYETQKNIPYEISFAFADEHKLTTSYILTSKKDETIKIVVTKQDGIYIFLKKIIEQKDQYIVTEYNSDGSFKSKNFFNKDENQITSGQTTNIDTLQIKPEFTYENFLGGTVSLTDFIGSYVYINLWATWSKPSEKEILYFNQIVEEFKDSKNIAFINLSIDDFKDYSKWRERVETENLKGIQLITSDGWRSKFLESLKIAHIPCAILIDPKGEVVEVYTSTPSNPKLKEMLYELLKKTN